MKQGQSDMTSILNAASFILLLQKLPTTIHWYASVRLACTSVRTAPTFVLLCSQLRGLHAGKSPTACLQVSAEVKRLNLHSSFISPLYAPYRFSNLGWQYVSRCQNSEENKRDKNGLYPYVLHVLFFIMYCFSLCTSSHDNRKFQLVLESRTDLFHGSMRIWW